MKAQNYSNHRRLRPMFHGVTFLLVLAMLIGSCVNLAKAEGATVYPAALLVCTGVILLLMFFFMRIFALKAQDRAIRAEENIRHFAMTGKLLDKRLSIGQVIALRFASDEEFVALAQKAADSNMSNNEIKKAIKNWRPDFHRA